MLHQSQVVMRVTRNHLHSIIQSAPQHLDKNHFHSGAYRRHSEMTGCMLRPSQVPQLTRVGEADQLTPAHPAGSHRRKLFQGTC